MSITTRGFGDSRGHITTFGWGGAREPTPASGKIIDIRSPVDSIVSLHSPSALEGESDPYNQEEWGADVYGGPGIAVADISSPTTSTVNLRSDTTLSKDLKSPVASTVNLKSAVKSTVNLKSPVVSTINLHSPVE